MSYDDLKKALPTQEANFAPCYAFSVHKSGSTLMHSMIDAVCRVEKIPAVTLPDIMFNLGETGIDWMSDPELLPIFQKRWLYYGFRNFPKILETPEAEIGTKKFVLLVRDPRDSLVSQYFSYGRKDGSHASPKKNPAAYHKKMQEIEDKEIDKYVTAAAPPLRRKLLKYSENLNFELGMLRRYEDIYYDKQTFLSDIFDHFGIRADPQTIARVAQRHDVRPAQEDDSKHIRKGTPGDHREKLRPETIEVLNDTFRDIGAFYGYRL
ncbi:hypothetical protein C1J03_00225 [Sulfitobacter sp. SK012]|uniref:sulfotransferase domain-containing protein n=1 Tax=Sulfitobacter sp. SK012 TaxID=1389005 RepID=UPI000E0B6A08|nr:sulfotransferase domain-containing protein [Sulfitobacter sp. SK012]AXI44590.1 hypothetical protein C1J03_00225 [Sulfitobacter sp. SK012]